jgi:hypothetical protein
MDYRGGAGVSAKGFGWDRWLSGQRHRVDWIACATGLAQQVLDRHIEATPVSR